MSGNPASFTMRLLTAFLQKYGYTVDNCWNDLKPAMQEKLQWGAGAETFRFIYTNLNGDTNEYNRTWDGVIPMLKQRYREAWGDAMREELETFMSGNICPDCHGSRLKPEVLSILVGGKNINDVTQMTVRDARGTGLPDPVPGGGNLKRRRGSAYPAGYPDRKRTHRGVVYSG